MLAESFTSIACSLEHSKNHLCNMERIYLNLRTALPLYLNFYKKLVNILKMLFNSLIKLIGIDEESSL